MSLTKSAPNRSLAPEWPSSVRSRSGALTTIVYEVPLSSSRRATKRASGPVLSRSRRSTRAPKWSAPTANTKLVGIPRRCRTVPLLATQPPRATAAGPMRVMLPGASSVAESSAAAGNEGNRSMPMLPAISTRDGRAMIVEQPPGECYGKPMDARQKYLFDTRGFLVLDDVLSAEQCQRLIARMKALIDVPDDQLPEGVTSGNEPPMARLGDLTSAGPEFCELIDIPRVIDLLKVIVHHELRLENTYGFIRRKGFPGLKMHGGGSFDSNGQDMTLMYRHFNGRIFSGHTVVAFNLTDVSEEEGGFACVPGSHKANFPIPEEMKTFEKRRRPHPDPVRAVPRRLGGDLHRGAVPRRHALDQRPGAHHPVLQVPPRRHEVSQLLPQPRRAGANDSQPALLLHRGLLRLPRPAPALPRRHPRLTPC